MIFVRKNPFTGAIIEREIDVTAAAVAAWEDGELIQNAMPDVSPSDRDFILMGITQEDWEEFLSEEDGNQQRTVAHDVWATCGTCRRYQIKLALHLCIEIPFN